MLNRYQKPFFFSTLAVALLHAILSTTANLVSDIYYTGYSAWWIMIIPLLCLLASVATAKYFTHIGIFCKPSSNPNSKWDTFYKFYRWAIIPIFIITEIATIYSFWGYFHNFVHNPFITFFLWLCCILFTFALSWLLYTLLKGRKEYRFLVSLLIMLAIFLSYGVTLFTIFVLMHREAYRDYLKHQYINECYIENNNL